MAIASPAGGSSIQQGWPQGRCGTRNDSDIRLACHFTRFPRSRVLTQTFRSDKGRSAAALGLKLVQRYQGPVGAAPPSGRRPMACPSNRSAGSLSPAGGRGEARARPVSRGRSRVSPSRRRQPFKPVGFCICRRDRSGDRLLLLRCGIVRNDFVTTWNRCVRRISARGNRYHIAPITGPPEQLLEPIASCRIRNIAAYIPTSGHVYPACMSADRRRRRVGAIELWAAAPGGCHGRSPGHLCTSTAVLHWLFALAVYGLRLRWLFIVAAIPGGGKISLGSFAPAARPIMARLDPAMTGRGLVPDANLSATRHDANDPVPTTCAPSN